MQCQQVNSASGGCQQEMWEHVPNVIVIAVTTDACNCPPLNGHLHGANSAISFSLLMQ